MLSWSIIMLSVQLRHDEMLLRFICLIDVAEGMDELLGASNKLNEVCDGRWWVAGGVALFGISFDFIIIFLPIKKRYIKRYR